MSENEVKELRDLVALPSISVDKLLRIKRLAALLLAERDAMAAMSDAAMTGREGEG